jgi:hypothetical protein
LGRRVMALDRSPGNHTYSFGRALGYPPCCCRAAAGVGDHAIDAWAEQFRAARFYGRFRQIDPSGYREGRALISHVPCSTSCGPSLRMAEALARHIRPFEWRPG